MKLALQHSSLSGFTLIEVVIASALMALILVSAYACLSAGYASQKIVEPRTEILQNARVAMAVMTADLRAACPLAGDSQFIGMTRMLGDAEADNLDFATHNYTPKRPGEGDYCEESFFVEQDAKTGHLNLYRRRNPMIAPDPLAGGSLQEIAEGVRGFKLEYYDGLDWYDSWGEVKSADKQATSERVTANSSGMPTAVRITLYLDSNPRHAPPAGSTPEPPLAFSTVARLNLAEASQAAGSAGAAAATGDANGGQNGSGNPSPGNN